MAYRIEGLRERDFDHLVKMMQDSLKREEGPTRQRQSYRAWVDFVRLAGGEVPDSADYEERLKKADTVKRTRIKTTSKDDTENGWDDLFDLEDWNEKSESGTDVQANAITSLSQKMTNSVDLDLDVDGDNSWRLDRIWPLTGIDSENKWQMNLLRSLLQKLPQVILHYLNLHVFPETMEHQV